MAGDREARRAAAGLAGAAVALTLALVPPATAAGPTLSDVTTISGDRAGYTEVEVPRDLYPFDADEPVIDLEGGGGILGVVLRSERLFDRRRPTLKIIRMDRENAGSPIFLGVGDGVNSGLPAGPYRMYLITELPGRVTLEFTDLHDDELALTPTAQTQFWAGQLPKRPWPVPGTQVWGKTMELVSEGLVYSRAVVEDAPAGSRLEACWYPWGDERGGASAYGPGCPGEDPGYTQVATRPGDMGYWSMTSGQAGLDGHGGNFTPPTPITLPPLTVDAFGMWLSYQDAPATPPGGDAGQNQPSGEEAPPPEQRTESASGTATATARRLEVRRRAAVVPLACSVEGACRGIVRLTGAKRNGRFQLQAGESRMVRVPLKRAAVRRVARRGSVRAKLRVVTLIGNDRREVHAAVRLVRARPRR